MDSEYILPTTLSAQDRLNIQSALYEHSGRVLIRNAGIKPGMVGLELGCGTGAMTKELLDQVGCEGKLVVSDISSEQLAKAKERLAVHGVDNISYRIIDINEIDNLTEKFDFVYMRMVLHHLKDADAAIKCIASKLNSGGIFLCEEPSIYDGSMFCFPENSAIRKFIKWGRECFEKNNRDCDVAYRVENNLMSIGFEIIDSYLSQPMLRTNKEKAIYSLTLNDLHEEIINHSIATEDEYAAMKEQLISLSSSGITLPWVRMHHISARKRS